MCCMLHRSRPVATASSPAPPGTAARGCAFVCLLPRQSGALRTALPQRPRRCGHAVRCECSTRHGGCGFSGAIEYCEYTCPAHRRHVGGCAARRLQDCPSAMRTTPGPRWYSEYSQGYSEYSQHGRTARRPCAPPGPRWYSEYSQGYSEYSQCGKTDCPSAMRTIATEMARAACPRGCYGVLHAVWSAVRVLLPGRFRQAGALILRLLVGTGPPGPLCVRLQAQ
jgi:hypothetical protein